MLFKNLSHFQAGVEVFQSPLFFYALPWKVGFFMIQDEDNQ